MLDFAIVVEKRDADRRQQCRAEQQEQDAERADDDGESHFGTLRSAANCGWTLATALHYASGCADGISTPAIPRVDAVTARCYAARPRRPREGLALEKRDARGRAPSTDR